MSDQPPPQPPTVQEQLNALAAALAQLIAAQQESELIIATVTWKLMLNLQFP